MTQGGHTSVFMIQVNTMKKHSVVLFLALSSLYFFADADGLRMGSEPLPQAEETGGAGSYSSRKLSADDDIIRDGAVQETEG